MRRFFCCAILWVASCFSEPALQAGACSAGSPGCACGPGRSCEGGYSCAAEVDVCVPAGCSPGAEACTCAAGECLGALACVGDICSPPAATGGETMASTDPSATRGDGETRGGTTGPGAESDPGSAGPTGDPGTADASSSVTPVDTGGPFDPTACGLCVAAQQEQLCMVEELACSGDCAATRSCFVECFSVGNVSCSMCCDAAGDTVLWNAFATCLEQVCAACDSQELNC